MGGFFSQAFGWQAPGWPLGLVRILYGYLWWQQSRWKVPPHFGWPGAGGDGGGLWYWLNEMIRSPTFAWHKALLEQIVVPNFIFFGWMTLITETFIGVTLILGLFTRLGALVAIGMATNITLGIWSVPNEWPWSYVMLLAFPVIFLLTGAGRAFGVDQFLAGPIEAAAARGNGAARLLRWLV